MTSMEETPFYKKWIMIALFIYVMFMSALFYEVYQSRAESELTKSQYLDKLQAYGYDITNPDSAMRLADERVAQLTSQITKAQNDSTINFKCSLSCAFQRHSYSCCQNERNALRRRAKASVLNAMPKRDHDLLKHHENYTRKYPLSLNYKTYTFLQYLGVTYVAIPFVFAVFVGLMSVGSVGY